MHQSVLLKASLTGLAIKADGIYIDGTFGRGGHSRAILAQLNANGRLLAIDKDDEAIAYGQQHLGADPRLELVQGSFADMAAIAKERDLVGRIDGILLDLGVSSPQLDKAERGFSFLQAGPLDMRMDRRQALSAADVVNQYEAKEMALIFKEYGEERFAKRIAQAIVMARSEGPIMTTAQLAEIVKQANPKWEKHKHPATRVFQALRIYVNQELKDLATGLQQCVTILAKGGRIAVISFHSLEDRIVKQFMRFEEQGEQLPHEIPVRAVHLKRNFQRVGKAIKPSDDEIKQNVRSRSAILRIGEKIS